MIKFYFVIVILIVICLICLATILAKHNNSSNVITKTECTKVLERTMCVDTIITISEPYFIEEK